MGDNRDSCVHFQMLLDLKGQEYKGAIEKLLFRFLEWADLKQERKWVSSLAYSRRWNEESGISNFHIRGIWVDHVKLYLYDETFWPFPKHVRFRDHYIPHDVEKVYLVADAFEEFLKEKEVPHERINMERQ